METTSWELILLSAFLGTTILRTTGLRGTDTRLKMSGSFITSSPSGNCSDTNICHSVDILLAYAGEYLTVHSHNYKVLGVMRVLRVLRDKQVTRVVLSQESKKILPKTLLSTLLSPVPPSSEVWSWDLLPHRLRPRPEAEGLPWESAGRPRQHQVMSPRPGAREANGMSTWLGQDRMARHRSHGGRFTFKIIALAATFLLEKANFEFPRTAKNLVC